MTGKTENHIIVFLDWDGVLYTSDLESALPTTKLQEKFMKHGCQMTLSPMAVGYLNCLCHNNPEVRVVCSSLWRTESRKYIEKSLKKAHSRLEKASGLGKIPYKIEFADKDPEAWRTNSGLEYDLPRGLAIDKWLQDFGEEDQRYLIIDDDNDFFDWQLPHLVQTDPLKGLDQRSMSQLTKLLKDMPEDRQMKLGFDLHPVYDSSGQVIQ